MVDRHFYTVPVNLFGSGVLLSPIAPKAVCCIYVDHIQVWAVAATKARCILCCTFLNLYGHLHRFCRWFSILYCHSCHVIVQWCVYLFGPVVNKLLLLCKFPSQTELVIMPTNIQHVIIENIVQFSDCVPSQRDMLKVISVTWCHLKSPTSCAWDQQFHWGATWAFIKDYHIKRRRSPLQRITRERERGREREEREKRERGDKCLRLTPEHRQRHSMLAHRH